MVVLLLLRWSTTAKKTKRMCEPRVHVSDDDDVNVSLFFTVIEMVSDVQADW